MILHEVDPDVTIRITVGVIPKNPESSGQNINLRNRRRALPPVVDRIAPRLFP